MKKRTAGLRGGLRIVAIGAIGAILAGGWLPGGAAAEEPHVTQIMSLLPDFKRQIVNDLVLKTLREINATRAGITQADIAALESQWQSQRDAAARPLIHSVVKTPIGDHIRAVAAGSSGIINEVNVMDANGLSIAQSDQNSDIWQGDEKKYQKTYLVGPDAIFIDEVEFDKSTQSIQAQANFAIADPATGKAIGAVSVGINVDRLN